MKGLLPPGTTVLAWVQNDSPREDDKLPPSESWLKGIVESIDGCVIPVRVPREYCGLAIKDARDFAKAGATPVDFGNCLKEALETNQNMPRFGSNLMESEPTDVNSLDPGPFPIDAFPEEMRQIALASHKCYDIETAIAATMALSTVSAALGKGVTLHRASAEYCTRPNQYFLVIAPTGYGKDSAKEISAPLHNAHRELKRKFESEDLPVLRSKKRRFEAEAKKAESNYQYDEAEAAEKKLAKVNRLIDAVPKLIVRSATGTGLIEAATGSDGSIYYTSTEAGDAVRTLLGRYTHDRKNDSDFLLAGYTGSPYSEERARGVRDVADPCVSLYWAVQPTIAEELLGDREAVERGLIGRFNVIQAQEVEPRFDDGNSYPIPLWSCTNGAN